MIINNRLHNTVIRIALVKMAKSYSRISLAEIASILELDNAEEARCTCMRVGKEAKLLDRTSVMALFKEVLKEIISLQKILCACY